MRVSVVMATRNPNQKALKEVLDSVYGQTYQDFELIIVDDGSGMPVSETAKDLIQESIPTKILRIKPSGLGAALNYGIEHADGEYIARIDDDDIMLPSRLERQVDFLDEHPDVCCVGTWFYDRVGNKYYPHRQYPIEHEKIIEGLLNLRWGLAHTTVMYRKDAFEKVRGYRIPGGGQDLDLFLQLGSIGKLANVSEYLTCYTLSTGGLGAVNPKKKDAYIFALKEVLENKLYPQYTQLAIDSINRLTKSARKKFALRTKVIRSVMITRIIILGKNLNTLFKY